MAYRTTRKGKRSFTRRVSTKKRGGGRPRSTRKRRTYRKRTMSKKQVLDCTSRKKQDNMQSYTNVTAASPQGSATYAAGAAIMPATQQYIFPWIATARDNTTSTALAIGTIRDQATRTAQTCFMRGLRENIEITVNDGLPWQWRRICFTLKGDDLTQTSITGLNYYLETSNGYSRAVNTAYGSTAVGTLQRYMFKGAAGVDWSNILTAPTDNTNISVKYDKCMTIASGNEQGIIRNYRRWHPMNKNLVYGDDEQGGTESSSAYSTTGKPGMGDYYVVDIFQPRFGATAASQMRFEPSATLYWHEK